MNNCADIGDSMGFEFVGRDGELVAWPLLLYGSGGEKCMKLGGFKKWRTVELNDAPAVIGISPFRNSLFLFELASTSTTSSFYIYIIFFIMMTFPVHCSKLS